MELPLTALTPVHWPPAICDEGERGRRACRSVRNVSDPAALAPPTPDGQAAGETFNYEGKTEIFVGSQGKNILIAECKYCDAQKAY
jgi:hypothetical protein